MTDQDGYRQRAARTRERRSHEALLKAGASMFAERGWKRTKLEDVAEAAGVGRATVFKHFGSKGLLAAHIYAPLLATLDSNVRVALEREASRRVLSAHVGELASLVCTNRLLTHAVIMARAEQEAREELDPREPDIHDLVPFDRSLRRIISTGQDRGDFLAVRHPVSLARYHSEALIHTALGSPQGVSPGDIARLALSQMNF
jgi:AcrR family transcriptional regulator